MHQELQYHGLRESIPQIMAIIRREQILVPLKNIILGGMGQGSGTAIHALLYSNVKLGGFLSLSGWLPLQEELHFLSREYTKPEPLEFIHSTYDMKTNSWTPLDNLSDVGEKDYENEQVLQQMTKGKGKKKQEHKTEWSIPGDKGLPMPLDTPVYLSHSRDDKDVPIINAELMYNTLLLLGMDMTSRKWATGGHCITEPAGLEEIANFILRKVHRYEKEEKGEQEEPVDQLTLIPTIRTIAETVQPFPQPEPEQTVPPSDQQDIKLQPAQESQDTNLSDLFAELFLKLTIKRPHARDQALRHHDSGISLVEDLERGDSRMEAQRLGTLFSDPALQVSKREPPSSAMRGQKTEES